jgi:hypothetical protein
MWTEKDWLRASQQTPMNKAVLDLRLVQVPVPGEKDPLTPFFSPFVENR